MVFRALILLFSYEYNIEIYKIIEATFLTFHFFALCEIFSQVEGGHSPSGPMVNTLVCSVHRFFSYTYYYYNESASGSSETCSI